MLLIYLPAVTPRTEYVFDLVFKTELGIDYITTTNRYAFDRYGQEKLNYSSTRTDKNLFVKASPLLFQNTIEKLNISVEKKHNTSVLFADDISCDMGFDIFAAVFYMVSRYEEYHPFTPDEHGRFKAAESLAYKNNFLQYPVVDLWIQHFKKILSEKFPSLLFRSSSFKTILTYDIDIAYAYRGRNIFRSIGATAKDVLKFKPKNILHRLNTFITKNDPWDVYDSLKNTIEANNLNTIFFFLLGDYSTYNKNIDYDHPLMKKLVKKISEFTEIGIHPSYRSSEIPGTILTEKQRLENLSNKRITKSRQHYLRFILPDTYNQLLEAGITEDYSMGFADMPGFRAGTCTPFYFYDLEKERATTLKIFPVTFMEGAFIDYMKLSPSETFENIFKLIEQVKNVNGTFISIWHNNTISSYDIYHE
jgi:hypothetical protein